MTPFSVIGGFLGAGKTTLINRLLQRPRTPRLAILVNDFGDIAIDAALLEAHGGDTIALNNGCVCCSIGNDLGRALGRVLDSTTPFEQIVVEASGVANPGRIMDVARISSELEPAGILVVVDAGAILRQLEDRWIADTVAAQLACADRFFINRLETIDGAGRAGLQTRLARDYRDIPQVSDADAAWSLLAADNPRKIAPRGETAAHAPFCSRSLVSERALDPERLRAWLDGRGDVYRIKGWARLAGGETRQLQYAGDRIAWTPAAVGEPKQTRLVVIGRGDLPAADAILAAITVGEAAESATGGCRGAPIRETRRMPDGD